MDAHKDYVSFYLASKSTREAKASYKLMILNQLNGPDEIFASSGVRIFEAKGTTIDGWGRDKFMSHAALTAPNSPFCYNDCVIFKVEITLYGELEMQLPLVTNLLDESNTPTLLHSMRSLMNNSNTADIKLVTNSATLHAHRCILIERSPVFAAMLRNSYAEAIKGEIHIPDVDAIVIKELLNFLYTDLLSDYNVLSNMSESLLLAASKYQVEGLVVVIESYLVDQLNEATVLPTLKLAESYSSNFLKDACLKFISTVSESSLPAREMESLDNDLLDEVQSILRNPKRKICRTLSLSDRKLSSCNIV